MKNLVRLLTAQQIQNKREQLKLIKTVKSTTVSDLHWSLKRLIPKKKKPKPFENVRLLKSYLTARLNESKNTAIHQQLAKLAFADNLLPIRELIVKVEWKKSKMWGSNPTAEAYLNGTGHLSSGAIGGCGYDKQSTAVAIVLNQVPQFLQLLYSIKNKNSKIRNHELFGYGSGYGILPHFEGGVGVTCYQKIFNRIGYGFSTIASGKSFQVFSIKQINQ